MSDVEQIINSAILRHEKDAAERQKQITQREQDLRHELANKINNDYFNIDTKMQDTRTEIALLKQNDQNMAEKVQEIKKEMRDGFTSLEKKMENFFNKLDDKYATKEEHVQNSVKIETLSSILSKIAWSIVGTIGTAIILGILRVIGLI